LGLWGGGTQPPPPSVLSFSFETIVNLPPTAVYPDVEAASIKWPQHGIDQSVVDYALSLYDDAEVVYYREDLSHEFKAGYIFRTIQTINAAINQQRKGR
jgi:hypothetical protein